MRYLHTPNELSALEDVEAVIRLLVAATKRLEPGTSFLR
jgi:putative aminopeptidase FrvX